MASPTRRASSMLVRSDSVICPTSLPVGSQIRVGVAPGQLGIDRDDAGHALREQRQQLRVRAIIDPAGERHHAALHRDGDRLVLEAESYELLADLALQCV